jgi:hypothetical protein
MVKVFRYPKSRFFYIIDTLILKLNNRSESAPEIFIHNSEYYFCISMRIFIKKMLTNLIYILSGTSFATKVRKPSTNARRTQILIANTNFRRYSLRQKTYETLTHL